LFCAHKYRPFALPTGGTHVPNPILFGYIPVHVVRDNFHFEPNKEVIHIANINYRIVSGLFSANKIKELQQNFYHICQLFKSFLVFCNEVILTFIVKQNCFWKIVVR